MKNEHIELVKKWLEDNDSVSHAELVANAADAAATYADASATYADASDAADAHDAHDAATYAAVAHYAADAAAEADGDAPDAKFWVKEYEKLENSLAEASSKCSCFYSI